MRIPARIAIIAAALPALAACSTYESSTFLPRLAEVRTVLRDVPEGAVRSLATITGVRRADGGAGLPRSVEARLRVENDSAMEVTVDPGRLRMVSRDLEPLPAPRTEPAGVQQVPAGGSTTIRALFPLDDGIDHDLAGLVLEWSLEIGGSTRSQSATFERRYPHSSPHYGYGPYWHPYRSYRTWW
ncbi:MAG: hypothetical protein ACYTJ0_05275 [Planctomycetota bacterium]|jgi:hypothetical protein